MPRGRPALRSVSKPKQARSQKTLNRLLDAAQELIEERGCADVSIPEVVARAKSSVGGFYSRFKNKDELLCALEERLLAQKRRLVDALTDEAELRNASLRQIARPAIRQLVHIHRTRHRLAAAFVAATARDPAHRARVARFREEVVQRFGALLLERRDEIDHPQPERAVEFIIKMVLSGARQEAVFGTTEVAGHALDEAEMAGELERMFLGYLGVAA
jgi:AcrR family transcriptional regulator